VFPSAYGTHEPAIYVHTALAVTALKSGEGVLLVAQLG